MIRFIVQAGHDTEARYGVSKCAEIVFEQREMVRREGLSVLDERVETMGSDENELMSKLME